MTRSNAAARLSGLLIALSILAPPLAGAAQSDNTVATALAKKIPERQQVKDLGLKYKTAWDLYTALKKQANGGQPMVWQNVPDWRGVYSRTKGGTAFDPDGPTQGEMPATAKFTADYHARMVRDVQNRKKGIEYDPLSQCEPPTYPRWLDLPFLFQFVVTPEQTTMMAEAFNMVRMIYTDGRDHIPVADRYPLEMGDSIGFWDGDRLIVHTNQNKAHMYERAQGFYSDQVEGVEIWRKVDGRTLVADVWIYDPPALQMPWYTRQSWTKLTDPDKTTRLRHWACKGNPNNDVHETAEGGSQFGEFTFTPKKDAKPAAPAPTKK